MVWSVLIIAQSKGFVNPPPSQEGPCRTVALRIFSRGVYHAGEGERFKERFADSLDHFGLLPHLSAFCRGDPVGFFEHTIERGVILEPAG
jgi:hypothetical protein